EGTMLTHPVKRRFIRTDLNAADRYGTEMGPQNRSVPLVESQNHVINPTNPYGALDYGIEDRLHVRGRPADDAEDLGRCRLMLQCLAQFCVARIEFFEQPHVFNRNHRLIRERPEKGNLLVGEGTDLESADHDSANGDSLSQQRRSKYGAMSKAFLVSQRLLKFWFRDRR